MTKGPLSSEADRAKSRKSSTWLPDNALQSTISKKASAGFFSTGFQGLSWFHLEKSTA